MRILLFVVSVLVILSCSSPKNEIADGTWRGILEMQGQQTPFNFDVKNSNGQIKVYLKNVSEKILLDEISWVDDSLKMVLHIFDAELRVKVSENKLKGFYYRNYDKSFKMPFEATRNESYRFAPTTEQASTDFTGKYKVEFVSDKGDTIPSVGVFAQQGNYATGTFLTPTGDYRFLEGNVVDHKLHLSTFDGNHAFLFIAEKNGNELKGDFWSGSTSHESWTAVMDSTASLDQQESLTYLKEGYDRIDFKFPDVNQNMISPSDEQFKNKVVILQIFGTWCPNCMDETKFLSNWYNENKNRGVEIIGLAYERKDDFTYASERVKKMINKLGVEYQFVIAGTNDKAKASETLPMLNKVIAFPTTIFIGKDGKVKHIRTGFEGPGTGIYYEQFKERFNQVVNELLAEEGVTNSK